MIAGRSPGTTAPERKRESLQAVAAFMIGRGYATVRVTSPGTITGVDEGPFPDGDAEWWAAAEDRVVSAFAAEAGVTLFRWYAHAETARESVRHGEAVGERTAAEAAATRLAVLSREPARAPVPEIVHRLGDPGRSGDLGAPVVLEGLDDVDWASLGDAYGTAEEVPDILRRLAANDEGWDEAVFDYYRRSTRPRGTRRSGSGCVATSRCGRGTCGRCSISPGGSSHPNDTSPVEIYRVSIPV